MNKKKLFSMFEMGSLDKKVAAAAEGSGAIIVVGIMAESIKFNFTCTPTVGLMDDQSAAGCMFFHREATQMQ